MTLDEYRERVEALARARTGDPVFNGSVEHAAVIVENMFYYSNDRVRILSGKLNLRVYGPDRVLENVRLFLADSKHYLSVLIEESDEDQLKNNPLFELADSYDNFAVRFVPEEIKSNYNFHFLVMDDDSYRFEGDKNNCEAIAAFGDGMGAKKLSDIFEHLWTMAGEDYPRIRQAN